MIISSDPASLKTNILKNMSTQSVQKDNADFNTFIHLLTSQLKNQDPLKPLDPSQTVTQIATFSSVEQAVKMNSLLARMIDISSNTQAYMLVGKTLSSSNGHQFGTIKSITSINSYPTAIMDKGERVTLSPELIVG